MALPIPPPSRAAPPREQTPSLLILVVDVLLIGAHFVANILEYKFVIGMATRAIMEGSVESTDVNNAVDHLHEIGTVVICNYLPRNLNMRSTFLQTIRITC